jgi:hypothetical protein
MGIKVETINDIVYLVVTGNSTPKAHPTIGIVWDLNYDYECLVHAIDADTCIDRDLSTKMPTENTKVYIIPSSDNVDKAIKFAKHIEDLIDITIRDANAEYDNEIMREVKEKEDLKRMNEELANILKQKLSDDGYDVF